MCFYVEQEVKLIRLLLYKLPAALCVQEKHCHSRSITTTTTSTTAAAATESFHSLSPQIREEEEEEEKQIRTGLTQHFYSPSVKRNTTTSTTANKHIRLCSSSHTGFIIQRLLLCFYSLCLCLQGKLNLSVLLVNESLLQSPPGNIPVLAHRTSTDRFNHCQRRFCSDPQQKHAHYYKRSPPDLWSQAHQHASLHQDWTGIFTVLYLQGVVEHCVIYSSLYEVFNYEHVMSLSPPVWSSGLSPVRNHEDI